MVYTIIAHLKAKPDYVSAVKAKLIEASRVYVNDKGTIDWFVHQGKEDPSTFSIVERFENSDGIEVHRANSYYAHFQGYVYPILAEPVQVKHFYELDTSKGVNVPKQTW